MELQTCLISCLYGNLSFAKMATALQPTHYLVCDKSVVVSIYLFIYLFVMSYLPRSTPSVRSTVLRGLLTMQGYFSFMINVFLHVYLADINLQLCLDNTRGI